MDMPKVRAIDLRCQKIIGGKRPLWHAYHYSMGFSRELIEQHKVSIVGAGNTADNAIKDWQKQYRRHFPVK